MAKLTIDRFRSTRKYHKDLSKPIRDEALAGIGGWVYCGALFIEDSWTWPGEMRPIYRWVLTLGSRGYSGNDLGPLEEVLHDWAVEERMIG